ncbi:hypothetical protein DYB28_005221, partial [Aphanomyces astaci]
MANPDKDHPKAYDVIDRVAKNAHIQGIDAYKSEYKRSTENTDEYWAEKARENILWFRDFDQTKNGH